MTKPRAIEWLEQQTGETLTVPPRATQDRHLSVRLPEDLAAGLEQWARRNGVSVSHLVRDVLTDAVEARSEVTDLDARDLVVRLQADVAEVTRRLAG